MSSTKVPSFLTKLNKTVSKLEDVSDSAGDPDFFFDSGSCIINKVISGNYFNGYAQGRMSMIAGPSNSGKSFLVGNAVASAISRGHGALIIDSENALDSIYMSKIGVDVDSPLYQYYDVTSLSSAKKITAEFFKLYTEVPESEMIPFIIVVDSIDMLRTDTQGVKDDKGETHNDMGQAVLQRGDFQTSIMHKIKHLPVTVIVTKQPYVNQDSYTNKREPYIVTEKLRYPHSQVLFVTNKLLKDKTTNKFEGINLEVYGFKTRFTKPFQKCIVEVPYETGMDWYSGVLEAAEASGIVTRSGSWYTHKDTKFQRKSFTEDIRDAVFAELSELDSIIEYEVPEEDLGE